MADDLFGCGYPALQEMKTAVADNMTRLSCERGCGAYVVAGVAGVVVGDWIPCAGRGCRGSLYPKLSAGGFVIVDDYKIPSCRQAVHDYRDEHGIEDEIVRIDGESVFWRRSA